MSDVTTRVKAMNRAVNALVDSKVMSLTVSDIYSLLGALDLVRNLAHAASSQAGWWAKYDTPQANEFEVEVKLARLALVTSEVAEAMEGARKGIPDPHLPHRTNEEVELADAVIRIADYAGRYGIDLAGAILEKLAYNMQRADHKPEARAADGGKKV